MMPKPLRRTWITACVAAALCGPLAMESRAGMLLDWLLGRRTTYQQPWQGGTAVPQTAGTNQAMYPGSARVGTAYPGAALAGAPNPGYSNPGYSNPGYSNPGNSNSTGAWWQQSGAPGGVHTTQAPVSSHAGSAAPGNPGHSVLHQRTLGTGNNPGNAYPGNSGHTMYSNPGAAAVGNHPGMGGPTHPGTTVVQQPVAMQPAMGAPGAVQLQPMITYAPHTRFRTVWVQVPVTQYQPRAGVDPTTGCPVTTMQPCTTQVWQAQRRRAFQLFRPRLFAGQAAAPCTGCPPLAVPAGPVGAPMITTPAPAPAQTPYYTPPTVPFTPAPTAPAPTAPAPSTPTGPMPADQPPALSPGQQERMRPVVPQNGQSSTNGAQPNDRDNNNSNKNNSNNTSPGSAGQNRPAAGSGNPYNLQPVPDPDAQRQPHGRPDSPRAPSPQDRTAYRPVQQAWACTPITWAKPKPAPEPNVSANPEPAAPVTPSEDILWDDSGWQSGR